MTRLAVLADIHGNLPALEAVIEDINQFNVDQVIIAGDMINLMPFSEAVLERVFALEWTIISGNHEIYASKFNKLDCPPEWKNFEMLPELVQKLGDLWIDRISTLPDTLDLHFTDAPSITVIHSIPPNDTYGVYPNNTDEEIIQKATGIKNSTILCGHSHFLVDRHVGRWHILNPGSVGIPLDGITKPSYMILDGDENGWKATSRRVKFDLSSLIEECERQGLASRYGAFGYITLEQLKTARHYIMPFFKWHNVHYQDQPRTIEHAKEFMDSGQILEYTDIIFRLKSEIT